MPFHKRMFNPRELAKLQAEMTPTQPCLSPKLSLPVVREVTRENPPVCWRFSLKLLVWAYMLGAVYVIAVGLSQRASTHEAILYPSSVFGLLLLLHACNNVNATLALVPWVCSLPFVCTCDYQWVHVGSCLWLSLVMIVLAAGKFQAVSSLCGLGVLATSGAVMSMGGDRVKYDFIVLFILIQSLVALFPFHNMNIQVKIDKT